MNLKDKLLNEITVDEQKIVRLKKWIGYLDEDGFDWDNVTESQEWAIRNLIASK